MLSIYSGKLNQPSNNKSSKTITTRLKLRVNFVQNKCLRMVTGVIINSESKLVFLQCLEVDVELVAEEIRGSFRTH